MKRQLAGLVALAGGLVLAGCSGPNTKDVQVISGSSTSARQQPQPIRLLTQPEITQAISGHTFQYTLPDGNGIVAYNPNGTLSFQDDAKGDGTGNWQARGSTLCQRFGSAPEQCAEFKNTGDAFQVGASGRLIEMKVQ